MSDQRAGWVERFYAVEVGIHDHGSAEMALETGRNRHAACQRVMVEGDGSMQPDWKALAARLLTCDLDGIPLPSFLGYGRLSAFCWWCGAIEGAGDDHAEDCSWRQLREAVATNV